MRLTRLVWWRWTASGLILQPHRLHSLLQLRRLLQRSTLLQLCTWQEWVQPWATRAKLWVILVKPWTPSKPLISPRMKTSAFSMSTLRTNSALSIRTKTWRSRTRTTSSPSSWKVKSINLKQSVSNFRTSRDRSKCLYKMKILTRPRDSSSRWNS